MRQVPAGVCALYRRDEQPVSFSLAISEAESMQTRDSFVVELQSAAQANEVPHDLALVATASQARHAPQAPYHAPRSPFASGTAWQHRSSRWSSLPTVALDVWD